MGERFESFEKMPTAEISSNQKLDEESFSNLSQTVEGLCSIESEEVLTEFAMTRDNKEDILYISKFIYSPEVFEKISAVNFESFPNLSGKDYTDILELAKLMRSVLTKSPVVYKIGELKIENKAVFIAYINSTHQNLSIAWKDLKNEEHIFESLLEKSKTLSSDYPKKLRSFGAIDISSTGQERIKVKFFGDASKKEKNAMPQYAPGILKNFKQDLKIIFEEYFPGKEVEIEIQ